MYFFFPRDLQLRVGNTGESFNITNSAQIVNYPGQHLGLHDVKVYERSVISNRYTIESRSITSLLVQGEPAFVVVIGDNPVPSVDGNHTVSLTALRNLIHKAASNGRIYIVYIL